MKLIPKLKSALFIPLLLISFASQADFEHVGKLVIGYETGQIEEKNFPIAYRQKGQKHEFQVGDNVFPVSGKPESYSFAMVLGDKDLVWLHEFTAGHFKTFKLVIGDYKLKLVKKKFSEPVMGNYVFSVNNIDYFFQQKVAQLTFKFKDEGIKEIDIEGMVASIGINSEAPDDCSVYADGSDEQKECKFMSK